MADFDPDAYLADPPAQSEGQSSGSFDPDAYIASFDPDKYLSDKPKPEGFVASNVRAAAHGVIPAIGAAVGGAALGTAIGGPVGGIVGAVIGGVGGGFAGDVAQDKLQDTFPSIDDRAQQQANEEEYPISTKLSSMAPFAGNPGKLAGSVLQRVGSGAMLGGLDAVQQAYQKGNVDPGSVLESAAFGAAFPHGNAATRAIDSKVSGAVNKFIPGRPGRVADPSSAQDHVDVGDDATETNVGDSSLAQAAPAATGETTGNPQSAPERSERAYPKQRPLGMPEQNYVPTQGDMDPATSAALDAANPPQDAAQETRPQPVAAPQETRPQPGPMPQPSVEAGFPAPGDPAAMGANDATPLPAGTPAKAAAAIARSRAKEPQLKLSEGRPAAEQDYANGDNDIVHDFDFNGIKGKVTVDNSGDNGKSLKISWISGGKGAGTQNVFGPRAMMALRDALAKAYPQATKITGERITGARLTADKVGEASVEINKMPAIKGRTPDNDTLSDAQKEAGNHLKARTHDFGKPIAIETHAGDIRRSKEGEPAWEVKLPYDYGYFNKTIGPDGDHIDFARPKEGSPEVGDKHFIVDQKNAETGKYDEPKVFTYVKDEATARDLYNRGFSDGKGPDRMHDITEVSRPDLVKYLAKHSKTPPKGPYGEPMPKLLNQREGVKAAAEKLKAAGNVEGAQKLLTAPDEALAGKVENLRARKYGVKGGYPVEGLTLENGEPATANTKPKATARATAHKAVADWFEETKPPSQMDLSKETDGELLDRIKPGLKYPGDGEWQPKFKPKEWMLAREAKNLLAKPTPGNIAKYRDAERLLRGGDEAVQTYRGGNRVDADVARSRRSGDEAVSQAENAQHLPGRNDVEDAAIAAIDARKGGKFDTPHEEAETDVKPVAVKSKADLKKNEPKTIDVGDSDLAKIDTKAISKNALRKAEAEKLAGRKSSSANAPSEDRAATTKKPSINIGDKDEMQKLIDMSNQAMKKRSLSDEAIESHDINKAPKGTGDMRGTFNDAWDRFAGNEDASLDINKIKADLEKALKTTDPKSYIARTPDAKLEPNAEYTRSISDEFHKIAQTDKNHRNQLSQDADKMMSALGKKVWSPSDLLGQLKGGKDQSAINKLYKARINEAMKQMYRAREADSAHVDLPGKVAGKTNVESLPPRLKEIYDEYLAPVFHENNDFASAIRAIDPERIGPEVEHHIARITQGDTSEYNMLKDRDDPTGPQHNGFSVDAGMAHERAFAALERVSDGKRFVIQNRGEGEGFTLWDKFKGQRIKDDAYKFEANQPYSVAPKKGGTPVDYIMRHATADEVMDNARGRDGKGKPMKYYQNAALSAFMTNAQMGSMARHLTELHNITQSARWRELTAPVGSKKARDNGWEESKLPNFKGTAMDPQLRYVLDDYAKPGFNSPEMIRNLSQGVTKLMFWMPTAHIANVGAHWFIGRGFDNLNVSRLYRTGSQAIKSVMSQDSLQRDLQQSGAGLILGGVISRDFIGQTGRRFGEAMDANPSEWGPIADKIGVPLKKLSDWIYQNSSKVMWAANDMFLTQRILELQEKGLTREQAINKAEKDIPNYRLPTTIGGSGKMSRLFQQAMADPVVMSFGRYHYGMFNSFANIAKEALSPHSAVGDRVEAAGKMLAMAMLGFVVYPALDKVWQKLTGNEGASANRRGPLSVPSHIVAALRGKEDVMSAARASLTVPPVWSTALETLANKDWRGKQIVEPGDLSGDLKGKGRAALQEAEHLARGLVSPYATFSNATKKDLGPLAAIRDQALDIKDPSDKANQYEAKSDIINFKNANNRFKHGGNGPAEGLYNSLFGR